MRTKALTDCAPSEYFILVFVQPTFSLCFHTGKKGREFFGKPREGKTVKTGDGRGWETTRGRLVVSKSFFLPEKISADLITGCGNSDTGAAGRGRTMCRI